MILRAKGTVEEREFPRLKKARMNTSTFKTTLMELSDNKGSVHLEFIPQAQTVNQPFYLRVLQRL
jgi:hypothetical protein